MESVITTIVGLLGGLALSVMLWHFTTHRITPEIRFSSKISKRYSTQGNSYYELRIYNSAKKRGIVDLSITCALWTSGIKMYQYSPGTSRAILPIPINNPKITRLNPADGYRTIRLDPIKAIEQAAEIHQIALTLDNLSKNDNKLLEKLLQRGDCAYIEIDILAYDEWSGARKHFRSPQYILNDVIHGRFDGFRLEKLPNPELPTSKDKSPDTIDRLPQIETSATKHILEKVTEALRRCLRRA